jgi:hypothetical protein
MASLLKEMGVVLRIGPFRWLPTYWKLNSDCNLRRDHASKPGLKFLRAGFAGRPPAGWSQSHQLEYVCLIVGTDGGHARDPSAVPALSEAVPVCDVTSGFGIWSPWLILADVSK